MSKIEIIMKLMFVIKFDARYLRIRFLDFSLFTERVTFDYNYCLFYWIFNGFRFI